MRRVLSLAAVVLFLPFIASVAVSPGMEATLLDVTVDGGPGETRVALRSDVPISSTDYQLTNPPRIVVDCVDVSSPLAGRRLTSVSQGGVKDISVTQFRGSDLIRVVIETEELVSYNVRLDGSARVIEWPATAAFSEAIPSN